MQKGLDASAVKVSVTLCPINNLSLTSDGKNCLPEALIMKLLPSTIRLSFWQQRAENKQTVFAGPKIRFLPRWGGMWDIVCLNVCPRAGVYTYIYGNLACHQTKLEGKLHCHNFLPGIQNTLLILYLVQRFHIDKEKMGIETRVGYIYTDKILFRGEFFLSE